MKDLVRLLIDQKADVLLIGGDFHEGCQYVPPVMAALAQVKTPLAPMPCLATMTTRLAMTTSCAK